MRINHHLPCFSPLWRLPVGDHTRNVKKLLYFNFFFFFLDPFPSLNDPFFHRSMYSNASYIFWCWWLPTSFQLLSWYTSMHIHLNFVIHSLFTHPTTLNSWTIISHLKTDVPDCYYNSSEQLVATWVLGDLK